ncbi:MAG: glycoside hydrolase family 19 protein, partial [Enterovibrio sp.]
SNQLYRCKSGVTSAWCSGSSWAYAPGTGTAWADAWEKVSEDEAANPTPDPTPTPTPPPVGGDTGGSTGGASGPGGTIGPDGKYYIPRSVIDAKELELTSFPMMEIVKNDIRTLPNDQVEAIVALSKTNPDNVKRVEAIMPEKDWNEVLFPTRAPEYTYLNFLKAVGKFPSLCQTYTDGRDSDAICRKSLATMFAHFAQETGGHNAYWDEPEWKQGLVHVREMGWSEEGRDGYNAECSQPETWQAKKWPCGKFENGDFKSYFGRGAKQLSYNFNYGPFSEAIYGDVSVLLQKPEMVAETWLNLASAIFFFVYPQPPKPSMLNVINGTWQPNERDLANGLVPGFGVTTQIINGGVECGGSTEIAQSQNRISYYRKFAEHFGVPILDSEVLGCAGMKSFDEYGAGAVNIYWTEDWSWGGTSTPDEKSYACQLVRYQTAYSAFVKGDYANCVKETFPKAVIVEDQ